MTYTQPAQGHIADLSAAQLKNTTLPEDVVLLDVREQDEWDDGHIEGAQLFPLSHIMSGNIPDIDTEQDIVIYCKAGVRSLQAAHILQQHGFQHLTNVSGGYDMWIVS